MPDDGNYAEESKQSPSSNIHQQISMSKVFLVDIFMVSVQYGKMSLTDDFGCYLSEIYFTSLVCISFEGFLSWPECFRI